MNVGRITSSHGPMPAAASARCSAVVPLVQATANSQPASSANADSNRLTKLPALEIQFVRMHSLTYSSSLPSRIVSATWSGREPLAPASTGSGPGSSSPSEASSSGERTIGSGGRATTGRGLPATSGRATLRHDSSGRASGAVTQSVSVMLRSTVSRCSSSSSRSKCSSKIAASGSRRRSSIRRRFPVR